MKALEPLNIPLSGVNLIEASAGTGKTYTITILYLRLVLEAGLPVESILAVTFTTAATAELKSRIRVQLRQALDILDGAPVDARQATLAELIGRLDPVVARRRLRAALRDFDTAAIFTIHGFCQRILTDMAFETQSLFDARLIEDQTDELLRFADDFWRRYIQELPREVQGHVLEHKLFPDMLLTLIRAAGTDAAVLPVVEKPDLAAVLAHGAKAFARARRLWDRAAIQAALTAAQLRKNSYKPEAFPALLDEVQAYLEAGRCLPMAASCQKLRRSRLEQSLTQKSDRRALELDFFDACEQVGGCHDSLDQYMTWLKSEFIGTWRRDFQRLKERRGIMHFDDLLLKLRRALTSPGADRLIQAIRLRFRAALIDEFQDTDPIQYAIFGRIYMGGPLFLIGDPKQAIYSFRGADFATYLRAAHGIAPEHAFTLNTNWRSVTSLVQAMNTLYENVRDPFAGANIDYRAVAPAPGAADGPDKPLTFWLLPQPVDTGQATDQAIRAVGAEIQRLMTEDGRSPQDMAVLVRTNRQASQVRDGLSAMGITCVLLSDASVFASDEALELEILLHALAAPHRSEYLRAALATDLLSYSSADLAALDTDERAWDTLMERFRSYHERWITAGFMRMFRELLDREEIPARLSRLSRGERRITNLMHLAELLHLAEREADLGMEALIAWLGLRRCQEDEAHELRLESDRDAVRIVTVHKSKGLEYPLVFCPFAWSTTTLKRPYTYHEDDRRVVDLVAGEKSEAQKRARNEHLAEDMRLLYVALTRARERCYVVWGCIDRSQGSPLAQLLHGGEIPKTVSEIRAQLQNLSRANTHIAVHDPPTPASITLAAPPTPAPLEPRPFGGTIDHSFRIASFTALTSAAHDTEPHDHDQARPGVLLEPAPPSIFSLPRGARTGVMLHSLLEHTDFTAPPTRPADLSALLQAHGFEQVWASPVLDMLHTVLNAPLDGRNLRLASVPMAARLTELEFHLPLTRLTPASLARALAAAAPELPPGFPDSLADLDFEEQRGYLRGFMDLVFVADERWYLIDWKSNHLGENTQDYHPAALEQEMVRGHYILQYHLYALALHRYLSRRLPDYDYTRDFGGVFYVFLRGVDKAGATGIHRARPSFATIQNMERMLIDDR